MSKLVKRLPRFFIGFLLLSSCSAPKKTSTAGKGAAEQVLQIIHSVNAYWQSNHSPLQRASWDVAAYHTGNMEAYFLTRNEVYRKYSEDWAAFNQWKGTKSDNPAEWKFTAGDGDEFVLFGDWQTCFQTYIDLYHIQPDEKKIARARQVMDYQIHTAEKGYWWWVDALYMVMPVMTKMYTLTGNELYLKKLTEYYDYTDSIMYDPATGMYFRDARYVYPQHKTPGGKKDFWARGDGWVLAGLAKVLNDIPASSVYRVKFLDKYRKLAVALKNAQQPEGYWTRSLLEPEFAPGPETSGTAFFTFGLLWGMNNGILDKKEFDPVVTKSWAYLSGTALQPDGKVGYVQPIGERAIPGQILDKNSTSNFGVGAFLLAACEMYRYLKK